MLKTTAVLFNFNVVKNPIFQGFSTVSTEFSTMGKVFNSQQSVNFALLLVYSAFFWCSVFFYAEKKYILFTGGGQ